MVWPGKPGRPLWSADGTYGPVQTTPESQKRVHLVGGFRRVLHKVQRRHRWGHRAWCGDLRPWQAYMPADRLLRYRDWVLAAPETLQLPKWATRLLYRWMENYAGRVQIPARCREALCPDRGWMPSGCLGTSRYPLVHPGLQNIAHNHWSQATTQNTGWQTTGNYP